MKKIRVRKKEWKNRDEKKFAKKRKKTFFRIDLWQSISLPLRLKILCKFFELLYEDYSFLLIKKMNEKIQKKRIKTGVLTVSHRVWKSVFLAKVWSHKELNESIRKFERKGKGEGEKKKVEHEWSSDERTDRQTTERMTNLTWLD